MLKVLQARFQQYINCELPDVQAGFRKGRETRHQIANISCIIKKAREFQKNIYFCFAEYTKAFDYESESEVAQSCLTLRDPVDCCLSGSSVHAISFFRGSSQFRAPTHLSCTETLYQCKEFFTSETPGKPTFEVCYIIHLSFTFIVSHCKNVDSTRAGSLFSSFFFPKDLE